MTARQSKTPGPLLIKWILLQRALRDEKLKPAKVAVLGVILGHMNDEGRAWPSLEKIAKITRLNLTTVKKCTRQLVEVGYLTKSKGEELSTTYRKGPLGSLEATIELMDQWRLEATQRGAYRVQKGVAHRLPEYINLNQLKESINTKEVIQTVDKTKATATKGRKKGKTFREWTDKFSPDENVIPDEIGRAHV